MEHATTHEDTPFCEQDNRFWVASLVVSTVVVIIIATYLAFEGGAFKGLSDGSLRARGAEPMPMPASPMRLTALAVAAPAPSVAPGAASAAPRGWLGVDVSDLTPDMTAKLGLAGSQGAFVNRVVPGSPAQEAAIQPGDVILQVAGRPVGDRAWLQAIVAALPPGLRVPVVIARDGTTRTLRVRLLERPAP